MPAAGLTRRQPAGERRFRMTLSRQHRGVRSQGRSGPCVVIGSKRDECVSQPSTAGNTEFRKDPERFWCIGRLPACLGGGWVVAAPFTQEPGPVRRAGGDVLVQWAERTGRRRAGVAGPWRAAVRVYGRDDRRRLWGADPDVYESF